VTDARTDISILSSGHDVADARLHRISRALVRAGLSVEMHGVGDASGAPAGLSTVSTRPRRGSISRVRAAIGVPWRATGSVFLVVDPDVVPSARLVARLRRRRLVVDVHEDYLALLQDRALSPVRRSAAGTLVRLATRIAARADLTVVADDHVPPLHARRRLVVRNLPDYSYLPSPGPPEPRPRAIYIGDVRRSRGLATMLDAVAAAPDWSVDIVGELSLADRPWLDQWLASSPAADRVRVHGRLPPGDAWALATGAWAGLVLLDDTPAFQRAVPTKLFEYLAAGLAVVATPLPRTAEIITASGAGRLVRTAAEAADVLNGWSADPAEMRLLRAAAVAWAKSERPARSPYDDLARALAESVEEFRGHPGAPERRRRRKGLPR
jgi:glycosyltransferase involved in cell wall biosynthesis